MTKINHDDTYVYRAKLTTGNAVALALRIPDFDQRGPFTILWAHKPTARDRMEYKVLRSFVESDLELICGYPHRLDGEVPA